MLTTRELKLKNKNNKAKINKKQKCNRELQQNQANRRNNMQI